MEKDKMSKERVEKTVGRKRTLAGIDLPVTGRGAATPHCDAVDLAKTTVSCIETLFFVNLPHLSLYRLSTTIGANLLSASSLIFSADLATYVGSSFFRSTRNGNPRVGALPILHWGLVQGGLILVLDFSGGLKTLQTTSIVGALPFVVIMFFLLACLLRELFAERYRTVSSH